MRMLAITSIVLWTIGALIWWLAVGPWKAAGVALIGIGGACQAAEGFFALRRNSRGTDKR